MSFDRFKYVIIICVLIGTLPLFSQVEVRLDSLQNIVSSRRYNSVEKIQSLLEMADIHYYLDYNDEMLEDINKAKGLLNKVKDNCLRLEVEYVESKYYYSIRMPQECQKRTERLLLLAQEEKCTTIEVNLLLQLSKLNLQKDKLDSSDYYIKAAKSKAINVGDSILMAKTDLMAAYLFYLENDHQKSIDILLPAYNLFKRKGDDKNAGIALVDLANSFYSDSRYDTALLYSLSAIPLLRKESRIYTLASNYNQIAIIYQNIGQNEKAIDAYYSGLKIAEEYNFISHQNLFRYNLGNTYYTLEDLNQATINFESCLEFAEKANDTSSIIYSLSALGNISIDRNELDRASQQLSKSYELALITDDTYMIGFLATSIANVNIKLKKFKEAQELIDKGYKYAEINKSKEERISTDISQAILYSETDKIDKAIALLNHSLKEASKISSAENIRYSIESLGEVYEKKGDFEKALHFHEKIDEIDDSANLTATLSRLVNVDLRFEQEKLDRIKLLETEKREIEQKAEIQKAHLIATGAVVTTTLFLVISVVLMLLFRSNKRRTELLKEKNNLISKHRDELEEMVSKLTVITKELKVSNATKSKLFSIIGHDLKNPFNVIQGYINLLIHEDPDEKTRDVYYKRISDSSEQLVEMTNVLLEWAMAQTGKIDYKPISLDVIKATNEFLRPTLINAEKKNIEIYRDYDESSEQIILADKNMLSRIVYNLVINAIKFTPRNGRITIGLTAENDNIKFSIKDTGIGMSPDQVAKIFEDSTDVNKEGTEGEKGTGLGLSICMEFVKKHSGKIWVESIQGKGSQFYFTFPIKS